MKRCLLDDFFGFTFNLGKMKNIDGHIKLMKYKHTVPRNSSIFESLEIQN